MVSCIKRIGLDLAKTSANAEQAGAEWNWQGRMIVGGKVKWVEIRSNHTLNPNGTILRRGLIQDITERKETAKESELRYQALVERLPIGVAIYRDGKVLFANTQAHLILGADKSQNLIGTDVLNFVEPEHHQRIIRRMKEVAEGLPGAMAEQKYIDWMEEGLMSKLWPSHTATVENRVCRLFSETLLNESKRRHISGKMRRCLLNCFKTFRWLLCC